MALSQVQCLDDNHVNWRLHESKPEFFYSEDQRLALEALIQDGRHAFQEYIQTHDVRPFLSELELDQLIGTAELYQPGSEPSAEDGREESEDVTGSLQYWPERSDSSIPDLDMGWPDCCSYRGVTRVNVYTQPPMDGQMHIKEVVRKTIAQAQKVIAVVMDLFTDVDIFKDLLDACFKRKLAVYIILEARGLPHFLSMCKKAEMHTGHLKNLRVRSTGGTEIHTRSLKKVQGSLSQKFMFVDGDRAVTGSYSYTWTASRLDRNLITVLTGQAVETFDRQFRELYFISSDVNLNKINLAAEPAPEPLPQATAMPVTSAAVARKLINPKYALVSCNGGEGDSRESSDKSSPKNSNGNHPVQKVLQRPREVVEMPPIHPGLLDLERANMIHYLPTWPEPDPPSDVIGFINIRDSSKPVQVHLMRSEMFETSQAIRFKDPFVKSEEPLPDKACPRPRPENLPANPAIVQDQQHTKPEPQKSQTEQVKKPSQLVDRTLHTENIQREKNTPPLPIPIPTPKTVQPLIVNHTDEIIPGITLTKKPEQKSETPSSSQGLTPPHTTDSPLICDTVSTSITQPYKEPTEGAGDRITGINDLRDKPKEHKVETSATGLNCTTAPQAQCPKDGSSTSEEYYECNGSDHFGSQLDLRSSRALTGSNCVDIGKPPNELNTVVAVSQSKVEPAPQTQSDNQQLSAVVQTSQEKKQRQPDGHVEKKKPLPASRSPASNIRSQQEGQGRGTARGATAKPDGCPRQPKAVGPVTGGHNYWQSKQLGQGRPGPSFSPSQDKSSGSFPNNPAQTQLGNTHAGRPAGRQSSPYRQPQAQPQMQVDRPQASGSPGRPSSPYRRPQTQPQVQLDRSRTSHSMSHQNPIYRQQQTPLGKSLIGHQIVPQEPTTSQRDSRTAFFARLSQYKPLRGKTSDTPLASPHRKA